MILFTVYGIYNYLNENWQFTLFITINWIIGLITHGHSILKKSIKYSKHVVVFQIFIISIYFFITGGVEQTGMLWSYVLPSLIFFIYGTRKAVLSIGLYGIFVLGFFAHPASNILYATTLKARYLSTFIAVAVFTFIMENTKQKTQEALSLANKELADLSQTDQLTQLYNRRGFELVLEKILLYHKRNNLPFTIIMGDIDKFKSINDTRGHDCGDFVLKEISSNFRASIRANDILTRWGGEEFLFFLPSTDAQKAFILAEKLRLKIENLQLSWKDTPLSLTISFGISDNKGMYDLDSVIKTADENLYRAKEKGRNTVVVNGNHFTESKKP